MYNDYVKEGIAIILVETILIIISIYLIFEKTGYVRNKTYEVTTTDNAVYCVKGENLDKNYMTVNVNNTIYSIKSYKEVNEIK